MRWQFLPLLRELGQVSAHILFLALCTQFVGLGEYDGEGHAVFSQPLDELQVYGQRLVPDVNEQEEVGHLLASEDIALDDLCQFVLCLFPALCISVPGQVDEVPCLVDDKVVDEHGLAGCGRCHGQFGLACKHIDKARLPYVRASYKGIFWQSSLRAMVYAGVADDEFGAFDFHVLILLGFRQS